MSDNCTHGLMFVPTDRNTQGAKPTAEAGSRNRIAIVSAEELAERGNVKFCALIRARDGEEI